MKKLVTIALLLCIATIPANAQRIFGAEYFIDGNDPGVGNATQIMGNYPADSLIIKDSISVAGLSSGVHVLYVRCKDSLGIWSHYVPFLFSVEMGINTGIKSAEAFVDNNDPGFGKATKINGNFPSDSLFVKDSINLIGLALGIHTITLRAFDLHDISSTNTSKVFTILMDKNAPVVYAEYFIDKDPGLEKGIEIPIVKSKPNLDLSAIAKIPSLTIGKHNLYVRVKDSKGIWSLYENKEFDICSTYSPDANFEVKIMGKEVIFNDFSNYASNYLWDFGDNSTSTQANPVHLYTNAGVYKVKLTASNICGKGEFTKDIVINGIQKISPTITDNKGFLRLEIKGTGFKLSDKVAISNGTIVVDAQKTRIIDSNTISATFYLNNIPAGKYGVVVVDAYFNAVILDTALLVQDTTYFDPWIEIIGPSDLWLNNYQLYRVAYGNKGNDYAVEVPILIKVPGDVSAVRITPTMDKGVIDSSIIKQLPWQRFYKVYDTLTGDSDLITAILQIYIEPKSTYYIDFLLKTTNANSFEINATFGSPLFSGPMLDSIGFRSSCNHLPPCLQCIFDLGAGIPGPPGCILGLADFGCMAINATLGAATPGAIDIIAQLSGNLLNCVPGAKGALKVIAALISGMSADYNGLKPPGAAGGPGKCWDCLPPLPGRPKPVKPRWSCDPNIKEGPIGFNTEKYITGKDPLYYKISFENADSANAPARFVSIHDKLDTNVFDINSISVIGFGFGDTIYFSNEWSQFLAHDIDLRPYKNTIVRFNSYFFDSNSTLYFNFQSLDPLTMNLTDSVSGGFLPPNVNHPEGEGFVLFSINCLDGLADNTKIENMAEIFFDFNEPVLTPIWKNSIDISPPSSSVSILQPIIHDTIFTVKWTGTDDKSGIGQYRIYYSENNEPYKVWLYDTPNDSNRFYGKFGKSYSFYSIALDKLGNLEPIPFGADAQTEIVLLSMPEEQNNPGIWIKQNRPNPFNGRTMIEFYIPNPMDAKLLISDVIGRNDLILKQGNFEAGIHQYELSSLGLSKGIYFVKLVTNGESLSIKIMVQ